MAVAAALSAGLVGLAGLAGCSSNPEPPPLEAASAAPSVTPTPSDAPPELPAEAKGTSEASAKAFVRHYFDVLRYAMNSGDTDQLRAFGDPDCESCAAITDNIEDTYANGGNISSRGWILRSVSLVPRQPARSPIIDLGVDMTAETVVRTAGAEPETFRGGKQPMTMYLRYTPDGWRVLRLDRVA